MLAIDIEALTRGNEDSRHEVATAEHSQIALTVHRTKAEADAAEEH
jgi:hypothetical protein